ncbi:sensor histidine kinase [Nodosilinea nodulosa]|uniref:sensor histidine kinase n=1 Tax=Nodosilinea nodulosa TaxID=416001 RepID=UPI00031647F9|nr:HAMP domain-containing sensor histidine kinase [Nodosilinea nodulosa]
MTHSKPGVRRPSLNLRMRLLLSHILVGALSVGLITAISHFYKSFAFTREVYHLQQGIDLEKGIREREAFSNQDILTRFHRVNNQGTLFSVAITVLSLTAWGCTVGQLIVCPLGKIEWAVRQAAAGDLATRVPSSSIPEIHRLSLSINSLIASLHGVEERRQELMADLAHELRTPMTVIYGYVEMFEDGLAVSPEITQPMLTEMERLEHLIADMLELSKVEAGHLPLYLESFQPVPVLRDVLQMFREQAVLANCQLQMVGSDEDSEIFADRDRFKQILINLVGNAIAHAASGTVTVHLWTQANAFWVAVTDTGEGIAPENLPRVFERFWRGDRSRNVKAGSSGIGLAITQRLVELQGGHIEVASELGNGTTFRFWLPISTPERPQDATLPQCVSG